MAKIAFYTQVYNCEKYLRKCIESVLNQTYTDFVYYIADDGSSDNSRKIIQEYADKDSRIIPFYLDNNNFSSTYNFVLAEIYKSNHEYFCSLDSDDWYDCEFAEKVLEKIGDVSIDLICTGSRMYSETKQIEISKRKVIEDVFFNSFQHSTYITSVFKFYYTIWAKLFKISILNENQIFCRSDIIYGGDTAFVLEYLLYAQNIYHQTYYIII